MYAHEILTVTATSIYLPRGNPLIRQAQIQPAKSRQVKAVKQLLSLMRPGTHSYDGPQTEPPLRNGTVKLPEQIDAEIVLVQLVSSPSLASF